METAAAAPVVVERAIEFEDRDGLVYADGPLGKRAFRRHTFLASFHNAAKLIQGWYADDDGAEVLVFPKGRSAGGH